MFDEQSAGSDDTDSEDRLLKLDAPIRIRPTVQPQPENKGPL